MGKRQHLFTSGELDNLFKYLDGASIRAIARDMGVSDTIVRKWLQKFKIWEPGRHPVGVMEIPWNSPLRCPRCWILLEYADGFKDGFCDWCAEDLEKKRDTGADKTDWSVVLEYCLDVERGG